MTSVLSNISGCHIYITFQFFCLVTRKLITFRLTGNLQWSFRNFFFVLSAHLLYCFFISGCITKATLRCMKRIRQIVYSVSRFKSLRKKKKKKIKQDKSPPSRKLGHIHFSAYFLSLSIPIFLSFTSSPHTSITLFLPFFLSFFFLFSLFIILRNSPSSIPSLYLFVFISLFSRFCVLFYFSPPIFFSVPSHFLYSVRQFLVDLC